MKDKRKIPNEKCIVKKCAFCNGTFYARKNTELYCSGSCKEQYNIEKNKNQKWYSHDPNKGQRLPLGTITSWEMPEDKLVFSGDLIQLYRELPDYLSTEQLTAEKENIENRKPYSETKEWTESSVQILTKENFIEIFRILPSVYKLYVNPWGEDNEKPFS